MARVATLAEKKGGKTRAILKTLGPRRDPAVDRRVRSRGLDARRDPDPVRVRLVGQGGGRARDLAASRTARRSAAAARHERNARYGMVADRPLGLNASGRRIDRPSASCSRTSRIAACRVFHHGAVEIAYLDEGEGEPIVLVHGFASTKEVNWVQPGWVVDADARRPPRDRARQSRPRPVDQALRSGRLSHRARWRRTCARCSIISASSAPMSWAIRWARGSRAFLALEHPERVRSVVLGGLGIQPGRRRRPAGEHRRRAGGAVARRCHRSAGPHVPRLRRPDQVRPPALAACIRGSRQVLTREQAASIAMPMLVAVGTKDADRRLAGGTGGAHAERAGAADSRTATTCSRSATRSSRRACSSSFEEQRMTRPVTPAAAMFKGAAGNTLVGDVFGEEGPPVLLLHGGGQTRHAWRKTGELIARDGPRRLRGRPARPRRFRMGRRTAPTTSPISPPMRASLADTLRERSRRARRWRSAPRSAASRRCWPRASRPKNGAASSPRWCWSTSRRGSISRASRRCRASCARMRRKASRSIDEAADAVAAYLPHRPRPRSHEGLKKNLRLHPGRPLALALGPALPRGQPPDRSGPPRGREGAGRGGAKRHHSGVAGARRVLGAGAGGARQGVPRSWCRTRAMSMSAAPATWWPATATTSSQTPLRTSWRTLK